MPERLVRQRRGLVYFQRVAAPQRAEHAAVLLLRRAHFTPLGNHVPGVARDGRARRLREGLSCCSREDGEHICTVAAAASEKWCWRAAFFVEALRDWVGRERLLARCALSRGVVKRPTEVENALSFASADDKMRRAAAAHQASTAVALRRTRPFPGVSQSNQTGKTHAKTGPIVRVTSSCSSGLILQTAHRPCALPASTRAAQTSVLRAVGANLSRAATALATASHRERLHQLCVRAAPDRDAQPQPWRPQQPCASSPSSPRPALCNRPSGRRRRAPAKERKSR